MSVRTRLKSLLSGARVLYQRRPIAAVVAAPLAALPLCALLLWGASRLVHSDAALPGVWVDDFVASGLARTELDKQLVAVAKRLNQRPVTVHLEGMVFRLQPEQVGARVDLSGTSEAVLAAGRTKSFIHGFGFWLARLVSAHQVPFSVRLDAQRLDHLAQKWERSAISDPPVPGEVRSQGGSLVLEEPRVGRRIDRGHLARDLEQVLGRSQGRVVRLRTETVKPELSKQQVKAALDRGRAMVGRPLQLVSNDGKLVLSMSREELLRALRSKAHSDPPRLEVYFDQDAMEAAIQRDRDRLEREPKDASFRIGQDGEVHIVPGRPGTRLDKAMVAQALLQAAYAPNHVGQLPVERDAMPEFTTEDARALNIVKLVGKFSTHHKCCQARVQNIHRIADILDGTVVKPGETFSVNEKVGPRTTASGFVPAPTIVEGDMEDTVGGGVSQFATTYFNALLHAGYDIVERQPHSYWFTRYPMAHEATLSYPKPDVIFRNDTKSGVLIKTEYTETRITVKLYGDNEGRKVKTSISARQDIVDPPVELVADPSLPPDEEKVLDAGMVGWSVIAGRVITFKDKTEKAEKRKVTYMPRVRRVRVHPCRIPEGEEGYTGKDCPEPEDAEMTDEPEGDQPSEGAAPGSEAANSTSEASPDP